MNFSSFIIESLQRRGVDVVFGLPGVHALGLWKAVEDSGIRYVGFRHEQAAAHAADGYGRATGRPGVVLLSTGPGALNSLSALGEALVSSSPVLAITSAIPSKYFGKGKGFLHEAKVLEPAFSSVTRYHGLVRTLDEIEEKLDEAWRVALTGRPGPVVLEIPADHLDADVPITPKVIEIERAQPSKADLDQALMLLRLAARPLIVAGAGVIRSGAHIELRRLVEALQAPVLTTFMGKGAFPEDHKLCIGSMMRQPETQELIMSADLLLTVGARYSAMVTGNWRLELPAQHIQIDIESDEIGKNYPVRLGMVADAKAAVGALADLLDADGSDVPESRGAFCVAAAKLRSMAIERADREGPREMAILRSIRKALPPSAVTVHDMTVPSYWAAPFFEITEPGTFHYPYGFGSLGFSLPASIGVAAADPARPVISFSGDGGFQYHCRELATLAQYRLPVVCLVFNDGAWGVLKAFHGARYGSDFGLDLPGPDFVALAEAYDIEGHRVTEPDGICKLLNDAVSDPRPMLLEIPGKWGLPPPSEYYGGRAGR